MIRIEQLNKKIRELQQEIEVFQSKCIHQQQIIKFDGKNNARWFCTSCSKNIRIPSQKELEYWISS